MRPNRISRRLSDMRAIGALRKTGDAVQAATLRVRAFGLRSRGFTGAMARAWAAEERDAKRSEECTRAEVRSALKHGFRPQTVRTFGPAALTATGVSEFDYRFVHPLNGKYSKWVRDRISTLAVFYPFRDRIEPVDFHILFRDTELIFIPVSREAKRFPPSYQGLAQYLQQAGERRLVTSAWISPIEWHVAGRDGKLLVDSEPLSAQELYESLYAAEVGGSFVVVPAAIDAADKLKVLIGNPHGDDPRILEAETAGEDPRRVQVSPDDPVGKLLLDMCRFAPQIEFLQVTLERAWGASDQSWVITGVNPAPEYPQSFLFSADTAAFLRDRIARKKSEHWDLDVRLRRLARNTRLTARRWFGKALYPKGLVPYQSVRWLGDMKRDLRQPNELSLKQKLWSYRNGLLSYRLPQYGITAENREEFISDLEYRWLRHINSRYKYWLEDKISIKYVAADFNHLFPKYYYHTGGEDGQARVVAMMDLPDGYGQSAQEVLRLARELGVVALKPEEGSHGDGFYRLEYSGGEYFLNGNAATAEDVIQILTAPGSKYLVTEFIKMHPELARIYPQSVNTLRMIVFKSDALTPQIGNAYLRIGSSASGYIDNTAAGGMMAEVDIDTGWFGNGQVLDHGKVAPCPRHPDTGELIEGYLPGWEEAKQAVLDIAAALPQLEYLGFDVAITEDGIKLPEINRFPDYPRINKLTPATTEYLLHKVEQKKKRTGYGKGRFRKLISLPKRGGMRK